jgi:hypothetical protein
MHTLQTVAQPDIFHPIALYDGKNLLYASHLLELPNNGDKARVVLTFPTVYGS